MNGPLASAIDLALHIGGFILGLATFLLLWSWVFIGMTYGQHLARRINRNWTDGQVRNFSGGFTVIGALILWLLWRYALPDWWIEATPLLMDD